MPTVLPRNHLRRLRPICGKINPPTTLLNVPPEPQLGRRRRLTPAAAGLRVAASRRCRAATAVRMMPSAPLTSWYGKRASTASPGLSVATPAAWSAAPAPAAGGGNGASAQ